MDGMIQEVELARMTSSSASESSSEKTFCFSDRFSGVHSYTYSIMSKSFHQLLVTMIIWLLQWNLQIMKVLGQLFFIIWRFSLLRGTNILKSIQMKNFIKRGFSLLGEFIIGGSTVLQNYITLSLSSIPMR